MRVSDFDFGIFFIRFVKENIFCFLLRKNILSDIIQKIKKNKKNHCYINYHMQRIQTQDRHGFRNHVLSRMAQALSKSLPL